MALDDLRLSAFSLHFEVQEEDIEERELDDEAGDNDEEGLVDRGEDIDEFELVSEYFDLAMIFQSAYTVTTTVFLKIIWFVLLVQVLDGKCAIGEGELFWFGYVEQQ